MLILFSGLGISVAYGLLGSALLWFIDGQAEAQSFFVAYTKSFKTIISLGLAIGTALVIFRTQDEVPKIIETAFIKTQLSKTNYYIYEQHFRSLFRTITFAAQLSVIAFIIFSYCKFPLSQRAEPLMMIAVCVQYALGAYVGRKLVYIGMMLHALMNVKVTRNLFKERELDEINTYVNVASTLTIISVYIHVISYYNGPFMFDSVVLESIRIFIIFPAVIATPVLLIFNFYPRAILRKLYSQSIDIEIKNLQEKLQSESLTAFEKHSYLIEFKKMSSDELRYSLQLTLSDLPIGITILFMLLDPLLKK